MVTCPKCGTKNPDEARFCVNCGSALYSIEGERTHGDTCFGQRHERMENECFGLPYGGTIIAVIIGLIIVAVGLGNLFGWSFLNLGPLIIIVIGILIVVGAIYRFSRRH